MKKLAMVAAALSLSSGVYAAQYGVGVELENNDDWDSGYKIYAPINISKELRVEPFVSYNSVETDYDDNISYTDYEYNQFQLGAGVYKLIPASDKTNIIIGGRLSYIDGSYENDCVSCTDENYDGWTVAPVLGFEYFPVPNLSVGAEVALEYTDINGDYTEDYNRTETETQSSINVKFYFN